jgi:hypothetical protein
MMMQQDELNTLSSKFNSNMTRNNAPSSMMKAGVPMTKKDSNLLPPNSTSVGSMQNKMYHGADENQQPASHRMSGMYSTSSSNNPSNNNGVNGEEDDGFSPSNTLNNMPALLAAGKKMSKPNPKLAGGNGPQAPMQVQLSHQQQISRHQQVMGNSNTSGAYQLPLQRAGNLSVGHHAGANKDDRAPSSGRYSPDPMNNPRDITSSSGSSMLPPAGKNSNMFGMLISRPCSVLFRS